MAVSVIKNSVLVQSCPAGCFRADNLALPPDGPITANRAAAPTPTPPAPLRPARLAMGDSQSDREPRTWGLPLTWTNQSSRTGDPTFYGQLRVPATAHKSGVAAVSTPHLPPPGEHPEFTCEPPDSPAQVRTGTPRPCILPFVPKETNNVQSV